MPPIKMIGSVPAQYSPVCTLVTPGTGAGATGAGGGVAVAGEVATAGVATLELQIGRAHV